MRVGERFLPGSDFAPWGRIRGQEAKKHPKSTENQGLGKGRGRGCSSFPNGNGGYHMAEENENKKKFPLWIYPETRKLVTDWYKKDNCQSQSEFIEKAIKFYCGYIAAENGVRFLPAAITSAMTGMVDSLENRMARLIFKLAVEMSMMMNILAANADVDENTLRRLRGKCVNDVKKSVGSVTFEDVARFQKGE